MAAPQVTAQSSEAQEVRASAFTLVGPDGTVLARLERSGNGNGRLYLYDAAGTRRLGVVGGGVMNVYDEGGTTRVFRAGFGVGGPDGLPINGVQLAPDGTISVIPSEP